MNVSTVEAVSANQFRIIYHPEQDPTENLIASAVSKHWQLQELVREQDSLEDIFMHLIKDDAPLAEVKN
jgi:ABC-2 type transport system ATP-binding protein